MIRRPLQRTAACILLLAALPCAAQEWVYTIRPGDEIWNIAAKYCGSSSYASRIIEHNNIDDERGIRPGNRLRIPIEWLVKQPAAAEVMKVRGTASLFAPQPRAVEIGQLIQMGHRLATEDGSVVVSFADGSTLNVGPESEVLFNVLTAFGDTGMVDTHLRFYRGRATSKIIRRDDASRFRISSPVGTAAVRGTEFRVAIDAETSITETLEGAVGFIQTVETTIPQGFGAAASATGIATEPLLPAPTWTSTPGTQPPDAPLTWSAVSGAQSYRVLVYAGNETDTPLQQQLLQTTAFDPSGLSPGAYTLSVRGVSGRAIEGYAAALGIQLATAAPVADTGVVFDEGGIGLAWQATAAGGPYTVQIAGTTDFAELTAERTAATPSLAPQLAPGRYFWRVRDATSTFSEGSPITVRPQAPARIATGASRSVLALSWPDVAGADAFRVRLATDPNFTQIVVDETVRATELEHAASRPGTYYVQVSSVANGIESLPATAEQTLRPSRWWLLLLTLPLLI